MVFSADIWVLAKSAGHINLPDMRFSFPSLIFMFAILADCALAQDGAAPPPDAKPRPEEKTPSTTPAQDKETKGPLSELPATGPGIRLGILPSRYQFLLTEAMRRFQVRDFKGATDYIDRADEILPPTAFSLNVRGAIAIEKREFERGFKYCSDALRLDPTFFPAKFNICEIPFLEGRYAEARGLWLKLVTNIRPGDPASELLTYRIFMTYLLENDAEHAKEWLAKIPFPSQTPAYQYANAALARHNGDLAGWDEWLRSADYIWPETKRSEFVDVMIQLGWLKRQ